MFGKGLRKPNMACTNCFEKCNHIDLWLKLKDYKKVWPPISMDIPPCKSTWENDRKKNQGNIFHYWPKVWFLEKWRKIWNGWSSSQSSVLNKELCALGSYSSSSMLLILSRSRDKLIMYSLDGKLPQINITLIIQGLIFVRKPIFTFCWIFCRLIEMFLGAIAIG